MKYRPGLYYYDGNGFEQLLWYEGPKADYLENNALIIIGTGMGKKMYLYNDRLYKGKIKEFLASVPHSMKLKAIRKIFES